MSQPERLPEQQRVRLEAATRQQYLQRAYRLGSGFDAAAEEAPGAIAS